MRSGSTGDDVTHLFNKLIRARCAIVSEIKGSSTLNYKALKQLASNDSIEYRTLYSPASDYTPVFKAIVATNTIPEFSAEAKASADISTLFRRMIIVNFPMKVVNIPESQPSASANCATIHRWQGRSRPRTGYMPCSGSSSTPSRKLPTKPSHSAPTTTSRRHPQVHAILPLQL
ncbi:uncharacterized protein BJ171DRAFT_102914 [Polychytrium aggregatum]|uniref:uncharacterized protein n=1 Tax=Polychytrium aggregatum TaxID=110093 RepID=UPI0022FED8B8|nr:uncharacterized protein BJ171DRAFT_102914 [Polychytrium aggregatum]KAI9190523.1 hypothetical protein BJ171DRAFT_102914 [Polychytrium aggregatum]